MGLISLLEKKEWLPGPFQLLNLAGVHLTEVDSGGEGV